MPLIAWDSNFSVNVKELDAQHQQLVEIINDLHEAMRVGKGSQEIRTITDQMVEYTRRHFQFEEKLLADHTFPGYIHQKGEHQAFLKKANQFQEIAAQGKIGLSVPVSTYLKDWWTSHILVEDKKYAQFLNAKGVF